MKIAHENKPSITKQIIIKMIGKGQGNTRTIIIIIIIIIIKSTHQEMHTSERDSEKVTTHDDQADRLRREGSHLLLIT
jgi:hypothetical protein